MRRMMINLYISVTQAGKNAEALADITPQALTDIVPSGSPEAKRAISDLIDSIEFYRDISKTDDFMEQILDPIKMTANLVLNMRKHKHVTTDLQCWVFAKSRPQQAVRSQENDVTLTCVCPKLRTTMSVKIDENLADGLLSDYLYKFSNVQPISLVNRMKKNSRNSNFIQKTAIVPKLSEYDFLFADIDDIEFFEYSFEMRHYSEISSRQSAKVKLLGAPLIFSGKLQLTGDIATITNPITGGVGKFFINDKNLSLKHPAKMMNLLRRLNGKFIRALCTVWYNSGEEDDGHPEWPEVFYIEEIKQNAEATSALHNILGHVRIRHAVSKEKITCMVDEWGERLRQDSQGDIQKRKESLMKIALHPDNLKNEGNQFSWKGRIFPNDIISNEFLRIESEIRKTRGKFLKTTSSPLLTPDDFLDENKLSLEIFSRKRNLAGTLVTAVQNMDLYNQKTVPYKVDKEASRYFKRFELAKIDTKRGNKVITLSNKGIDVAYLAVYEPLRKFINSTYETGNLVSLLELEKNMENKLEKISMKENNVPPSLIVRYLQENGYKRVIPNCELFWCDKDTKQEIFTDKCKNFLRDEFLPIAKWMSSVPHGFQFGVILETYDTLCMFSKFSQRSIMQYFEKNDFVKVVKKDQSITWILPTEKRVMWAIYQSDNSIEKSNLLEKVIVPHPLGRFSTLDEKRKELEDTIDRLIAEKKITSSERILHAAKNF